MPRSGICYCGSAALMYSSIVDAYDDDLQAKAVLMVFATNCRFRFVT